MTQSLEEQLIITIEHLVAQINEAEYNQCLTAELYSQLGYLLNELTVIKNPQKK